MRLSIAIPEAQVLDAPALLRLVRMAPTCCQFICSRCVGLSRDRPVGPAPIQLMELARQAEVDWCTNLHIAKVNA